MPWLSILLRTAATTVLLLWLLGGCARDENQQEVQQQEDSVSGGSAGVAEHSKATLEANDERSTGCASGSDRQEARNDELNGKIAFQGTAPDGSNLNLYVINADGSGRTNLTNTKADKTVVVWGAWSPDGKKISFTSRPASSNNFDISVINVDGSDQTNLTGTKTRSESESSWSPDGKKIAYLSDDLKQISYKGEFTEIYEMNSDGTDQPRLIKAGEKAGFEGRFPSLAWSPDGQKIAFSTTKMYDIIGSAPSSAAGVFEPSGVYVINPDGSGLRNLSKGIPYGSLPVWSPDGKKIAFSGAQANGGLAAYVQNADGTERRKLMSEVNPDAGSDYQLAWSPDGKKIAFASIRAGYSDIYVINTDGTCQTNLTNTKTMSENEPSWSPDGKQIAFKRGEFPDDSNADDIYVMNSDGTGRTRLADNASGPTFAPRATK